MYCVHCGADGAATFCCNCGKKQTESRTDHSKRVIGRDIPSPTCDVEYDWVKGLDYHRLLECETPRRRIAAASTKSHPGVTGEDILAVLEAVSPSKISWSKLTYAVVPIVDKLGIRTTKQLQAVWQVDGGRVLLAYLCTLASMSLEVTEVEQEQDACVLSAAIPLGVITNPGKVITKLEMKSGWVRASLVVTIAGQWFDWGKSKRMIEDILSGMNTDLMEQNNGRALAFQRVA